MMVGYAEQFLQVLFITLFLCRNCLEVCISVIGQVLFQHLCDKEELRGRLYAISSVVSLSVYPIAYYSHLLDVECLLDFVDIVELLPSKQFYFNLFGIKIT